MNYFSYRDENELLNIIIGLTLPRTGFPSPFYDLGYKVMAIEQSFVNGKGKTVKPDIIIANQDKSILVLFEAKSGKNAELEQLDNYYNIKSKDLINNAGFNRELFDKGFNVSYFCYKLTFIDEEKVLACENLIKSIEDKYDYPVIMFNKEDGFISLILNEYIDDELNTLFNGILEIPTDKIPRLLKFDQHTTKQEIKNEIIRNILSYILKDKLEFTIEELTSDVISPYSGFEKLIGSQTKKAIKNKVKYAMRDISKEKSDYFNWNSTQKCWKIDESLKDPNYNQLNALKNIISNGENIDGQMNIFEI